MNYEPLMKNIPPLLGLVVLVLVLLFVLANFGYIRACDIPGFSGVYYGIKGTPQIAIVSGTDGTGDPEYMQGLVQASTNQYPPLLELEQVPDSAALDGYDIVIVEHARTIPTKVLWAFKDFVYRGGKLVWIGDSGTALGERDYLCEKAKISFNAAYQVADPANPSQTKEQCQWTEPQSLNDPEDMAAGLCGKTFGDIVVKFYEQNESIYAKTTSAIALCSKGDKLSVNVSSSVLNCIKKLKANELDITVSNANEQCPDYNYWQRGPSETELGEKVPSLDFSGLVLGIDFIRQHGADNLFMTPTASDNLLTKGFDTSTKYFNVSNVSLVEISPGYVTTQRSKTQMNMDIGGKKYPMIIRSTPFISLTQSGLIVYYAFPLDDLPKGEGRGSTLVNNLFSYLTC
jgi:hypothetical protein